MPANESSDAAPADVQCVCVHVCVYLCVMPAGELVQYLCLSVKLACVADGLD